MQSILGVRTYDGSSAQGKCRIYFSAHPSDQPTWLSVLSEELFDIPCCHDCAIYFERSREAAQTLPEQMDPDERGKLEELLFNMQLFVIPVSTKYLRTPSRARDFEYRFACEHNIPILPILVEERAELYFNDIMKEIYPEGSTIQYLNRSHREASVVPYHEKLNNYLTAVFGNGNITERIQSAFDAHIFISYRKKDRAKAQKLMKMIHRIPGCAYLATWYDEFLTPGERWDDEIVKSLAHSQAMVLTVTPNLINPENNYVVTLEYPNAREKNRIPIIPVELITTDKATLQRLFLEIKQPIPADENAIEQSLRPILQNIVQKDRTPEHQMLMGIAYLNGIDVEKDDEKAFAYIHNSAQQGLPEAMKLLADMYRLGNGVGQDMTEALRWREAYTYELEKIYSDNHTTANGMELLDAYDQWRKALYECGLIGATTRINRYIHDLKADLQQETYDDTCSNIAKRPVSVGKWGESHYTEKKPKRRLFLSAHPDDLESYGDILAEDILQLSDWDIWYESNERAARLSTKQITATERNKLSSSLGLFDLVVVIVSEKYLTEPCRARELEFGIALKQQTPILPVMTEEDLDDLFKESMNRTHPGYGAVLCLKRKPGQKQNRDYFENLAAKLSSAVMPCRYPFTVFLCLTDRCALGERAVEIMKTIHDVPDLQGAAILSCKTILPGESWDFDLAATACDAIMDVDDKIDEICDKLRVSLGNKKKHDRTPEETCLLGMVFLRGTFAERDIDRAIKLFSDAAHEGYEEAAQILMWLYHANFPLPCSLKDELYWCEVVTAIRMDVYRQDYTNFRKARLLMESYAKQAALMRAQGLLRQAEDAYIKLFQVWSEADRTPDEMAFDIMAETLAQLISMTVDRNDAKSAEKWLMEYDKVTIMHRNQFPESNKVKNHGQKFVQYCLVLGDLFAKNEDYEQAAHIYLNAAYGSRHLYEIYKDEAALKLVFDVMDHIDLINSKYEHKIGYFDTHVTNAMTCYDNYEGDKKPFLRSMYYIYLTFAYVWENSEEEKWLVYAYEVSDYIFHQGDFPIEEMREYLHTCSYLNDYNKLREWWDEVIDVDEKAFAAAQTLVRISVDKQDLNRLEGVFKELCEAYEQIGKTEEAEAIRREYDNFCQTFYAMQ